MSYPKYPTMEVAQFETNIKDFNDYESSISGTDFSDFQLGEQDPTNKPKVVVQGLHLLKVNEQKDKMSVRSRQMTATHLSIVKETIESPFRLDSNISMSELEQVELFS